MRVQDAKIDSLGFDGYVDEDGDGELRLDEREIVLSYMDEDGHRVEYRGKNTRDGHFELRCPERGGHASLHGFQGGKILEGYWHEGGYRGMWRVRVDKKIEY